jgi:hypothetical protein
MKMKMLANLHVRVVICMSMHTYIIPCNRYNCTHVYVYDWVRYIHVFIFAHADMDTCTHVDIHKHIICIYVER